MKHTKKLLSLLVVLGMVFSMIAVIPMNAVAETQENPTTAIGDGDAVWDGTSQDLSWFNAETYATTDVFYIASAAQLASICTLTGNHEGKVDGVASQYTFEGKTVYLTKDIYLNNVTDIVSDSVFTLETHADNQNAPYDWKSYMIHAFKGTFDGQGHSVYGMYIRGANQNGGAGFFGRLCGSNATIRNLSIKYCDIENGGAGAGGIVGQMYDGGKTIENCHVVGKITAASQAGGIFGQSPWAGQNRFSGVIDGCTVRGIVTATGGSNDSGAGGVTSYVNVNSGTAKAIVRNTYVFADVVVKGAGSVGGIFGYAEGKNATTIGIENCGVSGKIIAGTTSAAATSAGGFIGHALLGSNFNIVGSYSAATFEIANASTVYGQIFGTIDWSYYNIGVGGRQDPSVAEMSMVGTYYLSGVSGTAPTPIGTNTDTEHIYTSMATAVTREEATSRSTGSLLVRLNEWVAEHAEADNWHIGTHGYPVQDFLPAAPEYVNFYEELENITSVGTLRGAEVKLTNPDETVLRFSAAVKDSYISTLNTKHTVREIAPKIEVGTVLIETSHFETYHLTPSASYLAESEIADCKTVIYNIAVTDADTATGTHYWYALTDTITTASIATAYSALSFVKVTDADNEVAYYDASYATERNSRSALDVARMAYADRDTSGNTVYNTSMFSVMERYLDSAVSVSMTDGGTTVVTDYGDYYANPYTVEKKDNGDLVITGAHLTADSEINLVVNGITRTDRGDYPNAAFTYAAGQVTVSLTPFASDVAAVELLPARVEAWQDLGLDLTLKNIVTRTDTEATDTPTLVWSSANPSVASVDKKGSLTLVSAGKTYVVASTPDGVISNTVVVTVTAPINRAADQQISLPATSTSRVNIAEYLALPTGGYGDAQIAMWYGNATGAVSITIDDSKTGDFPDWNTASNNYDLPVTFIVPAHASGYHANYWREQVAAGQDVQSHSLIHGTGEQINAMSTAEVWMDYYESVPLIYNVTGQNVEVFGYSFGVGLEDYAGELFISARGTHGTPNEGDKINYRFLNSSSRGFVNDLPALVRDLQQVFTEGNQYYGGWYSYHLHGLAHNFAAYTDATTGTVINTVTDWLNCWFGEYLQPMRDSNDLWADSYRNVAKYGQERDTATLSISENANGAFEVSIHDLMDDTIFTQALTVKIMVDDTWEAVKATNAKGERVFSEIYTSEEGRFVFVDVVPDQGVVTVERADPSEHEHSYTYAESDAGHIGTCTCGDTTPEEPHSYVGGVCKCGKEEPAVHQHSYTYTESGTGHIGACTCGEDTELEMHEMIGGACKQCGHTHAYTYSVSGAGHVGTCVCGDTTAQEAHDMVQGTCSLCSHTHTYVYTESGDGHVGDCSTCDAVTSQEAHAYVNGTCKCGAEAPAHDHTYHYTIGDTGHIGTCTSCGNTTLEEPHTHENGSCTKCGLADPDVEEDDDDFSGRH